ncbi:OsmC family protein [Humibacter ginsenosidimutans]|uniref:OsmC family protein n=1 Tax=Humibacter ginsenosidimutans TaxID=2599293 RepID=A0A5B8M8A7_9MICO|nr:OsmC family protein [Humibacter ginsenosidimutans]QDZ16451.1 OsmC family protein [Humibacter ginsenosidimutans]
MFTVRTSNVAGRSAAIGAAGPFTLVVDRSPDAGGDGLGFSGGQLLYLAVAGCVSNDLFREADAAGIRLRSVAVTVVGDFAGSPAVSDAVSYDVELAGDADEQTLRALAERVDAIAEVPNSLRGGTPVALRHVTVG